MKKKPLISIIVIVFDMPRQAMNTLYSLSALHQKNIDLDDYEVIVVENNSKNQLHENHVLGLKGNFRYFLREESSPSPVNAINFAYQQCQGQMIGLIIDGAQMVTPRVLEYSKMAHLMNPHALVTIPAYHLGEVEQKHLTAENDHQNIERLKLQQLNWRENGYRLFQYACFAPSNNRGYFQPMQESSCLFCHRKDFEAIGQADERFNLPGGGSINLHIYRSLGLLKTTQLFVLPGEGTFHQFHGGVTTSEVDKREDTLIQFKQQIDDIWQGKFQSLTQEPTLLGAVTFHSQPFMEQSSELGMRRFTRLAKNKKSYWPDDEYHDRFTENKASDTDENEQWRITEVIPPEFRW